MDKWYEQRYVNRRDWVLENMEYLGLSAEEMMFVFVIDYCNQYNIVIDMDLLQKKTAMNQENVDRVISLLCAKEYLKITANREGITFSLDGLFETDVMRTKNVFESNLFSIFNSEFGRPLTQQEMQKVSDWLKENDSKVILYALREASAYQKLSLPYIEAILNRWKKDHITLEQLDKGITYGN